MTWPTEDEVALAAEVSRLLERTASREDLKAAAQPTSVVHDVAWKQLATQLGVAGLAVPEEFGGAGADLGALAAVAEQVGRACAAVPFLSTALAAVGETDLLGAVAAGEQAATLAAPLDGAKPAVRAQPLEMTSDVVGGAWALTGTATAIDGATADVLLVVAKTGDGVGLFAVEGGARTPLNTTDLGRPQARIEFDATPARLLAEDGSRALQTARQVAKLLLAAENLGIADWCVQTAVDYAKTREQFGVKIGTFQAVKHLCAEMFFATEVARALLVSAVDLCRGEIKAPGRTALNAAAVACAEAAVAATQGAVSVLGGIGFTWEHGARGPTRCSPARPRPPRTLSPNC